MSTSEQDTGNGVRWPWERKTGERRGNFYRHIQVWVRITGNCHQLPQLCDFERKEKHIYFRDGDRPSSSSTRRWNLLAVHRDGAKISFSVPPRCLPSWPFPAPPSPCLFFILLTCSYLISTLQFPRTAEFLSTRHQWHSKELSETSLNISSKELSENISGYLFKRIKWKWVSQRWGIVIFVIIAQIQSQNPGNFPFPYQNGAPPGMGMARGGISAIQQTSTIISRICCRTNRGNSKDWASPASSKQTSSNWRFRQSDLHNEQVYATLQSPALEIGRALSAVRAGKNGTFGWKLFARQRDSRLLLCFLTSDPPGVVP